jgi:hypothetical protein
MKTEVYDYKDIVSPLPGMREGTQNVKTLQFIDSLRGWLQN